MAWPERSDRPMGMLSDLRILDFSTFLPGPWCTQVMGDMGADVIKVEPPHGDPARELSGGLYETTNRNKRGIVLDLKNETDQRAALILAASADIVVEGFRPGVADRLGIGFEAVKAVQPKIVYCSISGFGQTGPWALRAGHDLTYLATSGALSFSPHWHGRPKRSGVPVADLAAASLATISILAALRERDRSGEASYLDVSICDAALAFIAPRGGAGFRNRNEDRLGAYPNNDLFDAADGQVLAVSAVEPKFWERLRMELGKVEPDLLSKRFDTQDDRYRNGDELYDLLARAFRRRPAEEWVEIFEKLDVAVERVLTIAEAARTPQAVARSLVVGEAGAEGVAFPVHRNGKVIGLYRTPPPKLDEHSEAVQFAIQAAAS